MSGIHDFDAASDSESQGAAASATDEAAPAPETVPTPEQPWTWWSTHAELMSVSRTAPVDDEDLANAVRAYKVMYMLTDAHNEPELLQLKAEGLSEALFQAYSPHSRASFHHIGVVLQFLMNKYPNAVASAFTRHADWLVPSMVQFFHEAPVADTLCQLVTQKHNITAFGGAGVGASSAAMNDFSPQAMFSGPAGSMHASPHTYNKSASAINYVKARELMEKLAHVPFLRHMARVVAEEQYTAAHAEAGAASIVTLLDYLRRYRIATDIFEKQFKPASACTALSPTDGFMGLLMSACTQVAPDTATSDGNIAGNHDGLLDMAGSIPRRATIALQAVRRLLTFAFVEKSAPPPDQPMTQPGAPTPATHMPRDNIMFLAGAPQAAVGSIRSFVSQLASSMVAAHLATTGTSLVPPKKRRGGGKKGKKAGAAAASPAPGSASASPGPVTPVAALDALEVKHPGHSVRVPLGMFRLLAVQVLADMSEFSDVTVDGQQLSPASLAMEVLSETPEAVGAILSWVQTHPNSSMLQAAFLQLLTNACRRNAEPLLKVIFSTYKLLTTLLKGYVSTLAQQVQLSTALSTAEKPKDNDSVDAAVSTGASTPVKRGVAAAAASQDSAVGGGKDIWADGDVPNGPSSPDHLPAAADAAASPAAAAAIPPVAPKADTDVKPPLTPASPAGAYPPIGPVVASATASNKDTAALNGTTLRLLNVVRLVAASQPADAFLPNHLEDHAKWGGFQATLVAATEQQVKPIVKLKKQGGNANLSMLGGLLGASASELQVLLARLGVPSTPEAEEEEGDDETRLDLGSDFAESLGLGDLVPTATASSEAASDDGASGASSDGSTPRQASSSAASTGSVELEEMD